LCLPVESWDALEADLLRSGHALNDYPQRFSLRTLISFYRHSPRGSAVYQVEYGEKADWGTLEELTARVLEALWDANWQRSGRPHAPKPKPIPRPGQPLPPGIRHYGGEGMTIDQFEERWAA
jgi:hypothetical protein